MPAPKKQPMPAYLPEKKQEHFSYQKGWDSFMLDADTVDHVTCKICGTKCDVKRNVSGPRTMAESMAGKDVRKDNPHDHFFCPHSGYPWHNQALAILLQARINPSAAITKILEEEAKQIVLTKHSTKEAWLL
jgi:hypothetical protein